MDICIFKNKSLPWVELRYTKVITDCIKLHTHGKQTIVGIETGALEIFYKSHQPLLTPKSIALINPNQPHYGKIMESNSTHGYVLYIDIAWWNNLYHIIFNYASRPTNKNIIENTNIYKLFIGLCKTLLSTTSSIHEKESLTVAFILNLFTFAYQNSEYVTIIKSKSIASKIKIFLDKNQHHDISIDQISKFIGLSKFYVLNIFKKEYGITPHSYLLNLKVHRAKDLIDSGVSIIDAALDAGFYDQSHFSRVFKEIFTITPKQYQKNRIL